MPEIAMGALIENGSVLLARRSPGRRQHPDRWSLPGGQFVTKFGWQGQSATSARFHIYRIDRWRGCPRPIDDEHTKLKWFSAAEIKCETELALPELSKILMSLTIQGNSKD
ncbi:MULTISPECIES: NUDIX hydrolase [unclassified Rhizobium]|uniref:NUDIX hydrolase n=1 Tax=unclassified Rhizobium TaxID=2613769 RepID=UPI001C83776D|nr:MULTISPECIES: DNA mismatch repair protein MutT [unclassified Rhizobium]MBX5225680.1 DNA mismatch repair protein MutT [Rhizobium sp. NLR9b]MBX5239396.1 DNA mismatch repair protein MutT [Rhizobium sp. NLR22b]MBX5286353.1 DNA mismatch repair protein MutT [Rhizobium sp. NLR10b]